MFTCELTLKTGRSTFFARHTVVNDSVIPHKIAKYREKTGCVCWSLEQYPGVNKIAPHDDMLEC